MRVRSFQTFSACVLAGLVVPALSIAASWNVHRVPVAGPALVGSRVLWVAPRPDHGGDLISARAGRTPRRVGAFPADAKPGPGTYLSVIFGLAGSSSAVALLSHRFCTGTKNGADPCGDSVNVFSGEPGTRLETIEHCDRSLGGGFGVSGQLFAFPRCDGKLVVRDLGGGRPDMVFGDIPYGGQVAGYYIAWEEYGSVSDSRGVPDVVVYDLAAGAVSYTVPHSRIPGQIAGLTVERDGKVAFAFNSKPNSEQPREVLGWASRQEPKIHRIPLSARRFYGSVRMAGNRIAYTRPLRESDNPAMELGMTDLSGRSWVIARGVSRSSGIDFDGRRIAYVQRSGRRRTVVRHSVPH